MNLRTISLCLLLLCSACLLMAQDVMPQAAPRDMLISNQDTLMRYGEMRDTLPLPIVNIPTTFKNMQANEISDSIGLLTPFLHKMRLALHERSTDSIRVLHVGDSHVRGHIFPRAVGDSLQQLVPNLRYTDMGINGATTVTFATPQHIARIKAQKPDLLILSFGTNECHGGGYNTLRHYHQMDDFVRMLREALPGVPILMTTPPGDYIRTGRGRNRSYKANTRLPQCVQTIHRYCYEHGVALWDLYTICGGQSQVLQNWQSARLMRPDHVHYMPDGYTLHGQLLLQALVKAYNNYVGFN